MHELWPCLYEKAVAKMFGSYAQMDQNSPVTGFSILSGAAAHESLWISKEADGWLPYISTGAADQIANGQKGFTTADTWPDDVKSPVDEDKPYQLDQLVPLLDALDSKCCIMCARHHPGRRRRACRREWFDHGPCI